MSFQTYSKRWAGGDMITEYYFLMPMTMYLLRDIRRQEGHIRLPMAEE